MIVFAGYTADLTGYLSIYIADTNIRSLEDLAAQSKIKVIINSGGNTQFITKSNTTFEMLKCNIKVYNIFCSLQLRGLLTTKFLTWW